MSTTINYRSDGASIRAEVYSPAAGSSAGGLVVVAYGTDGLTKQEYGDWGTMIRGCANSLAQAGFVAMIPHYFDATGTTPGLSVFDQISTHRDRWQEAISDAISHGKAQPGVAPSRIGLLGFSLGGHLCLRLRAKANVLVEHFAPMDIGTSGPLKHAQIHHGDADKLVPYSPHADAIADTLRDELTPTELFRYADASHGFAKPTKADVDARTQSKTRTVECFVTHL